MGVTNRDLESPDETRTFDHGQVQVVKIGESTIGRYTFEPGWRWSESVKPIAKTDSCQAHHIGYILVGQAARGDRRRRRGGARSRGGVRSSARPRRLGRRRRGRDVGRVLGRREVRHEGLIEPDRVVFAARSAVG